MIHSLQNKIREFLFPKLSPLATKHPSVKFSRSGKYLVTASLAVNILELAIPVMSLQIYDRILTSQNTGTLNMLAVGALIALFLNCFLRFLRAYITNWTGSAYEHSVSCNSMRHILGADLAVLEKYSVSEHLQRLGSVSKLRDFISGQVLLTLIDLPFVFIFLGLITYLAGPLVLVPLTLLFLFIVIASLLGAALTHALEKREKNDHRRLGFFIESLEGIHTIKSFGLEGFFKRRYEAIQKDMSISNYDVSTKINTAHDCGYVFTHMMTVFMVIFGTQMAVSGAMTLGTLIACILLSGRIMSPIQRVFTVWARYQDFRLAQRSINSLFEVPTYERGALPKWVERTGTVEMTNVDFTYHGSETPTLQNLNLTLHIGDVISISGEHGGGKTTFLKLVAGLYKPTSGTIEVDGFEACLYPSVELAKHVGLLEMEGVIYKGSIYENISSFGEVPPEKVMEIIRLLDIEKDIAQLPSGFETQLEGNTADPIPPGMKQIISIARVLSYKPRVLLFDNADKALDKDGYNKVYRLLARLTGKVTMIIHSEDLNMKRLASRHFVFHKGKLTPADKKQRALAS